MPTPIPNPFSKRCHAFVALSSSCSAIVASAALVACALPSENPVVWDSRTTPPSIEPTTLDGKCALVVSGVSKVTGKAVSHVSLTVERGLARIEVDLAPPDQWTSNTFHAVVPVEEQHVSVIYVGATSYPVWERGHSATDCPR